MENNVTTLETAKKLKAAGFDSSTALWYWQDPEYHGWRVVVFDDVVKHEAGEGTLKYRAPTAQEIAGQINFEWALNNIDGYQIVYYTDDKYMTQHTIEAENIVEALAALWLKLHVTQTPTDGGSDE